MMAVDTREKRQSAFALLFRTNLIGVEPSSFDQAQRQASAHMYSGILADSPIPSTIIAQARSISRIVFARVFGRIN